MEERKEADEWKIEKLNFKFETKVVSSKIEEVKEEVKEEVTEELKENPEEMVKEETKELGLTQLIGEINDGESNEAEESKDAADDMEIEESKEPV